ncbi:RNA polymerase sigma factor [Tenacibaculum sp. nBUS_03]|uniref:RNA polymerase sigma factor n=1 Tax=Tenacibaculum sp. nBUS_03 TaxID=3395320 RepID=UPI003EBE3FB4
MSKKKVHEDQKFIDGLAQNNSFIIKTIYEKFAPKVINFIVRNNGNESKAQDIIQETLITIYSQATHQKLQLTCPFDAYFFLLCKRKWLNELKKTASKKVTITNEFIFKEEEVEDLIFETSTFEQKQAVFNTMFDKLGKACKDLLKTSFKIKSMETVASTLGISYAYARKKKSQCIGKLTKLIKESSSYNQLKNNL